MGITIIGMGSANGMYLVAAGAQAISAAEVLIGSKRLLAGESVATINAMRKLNPAAGELERIEAWEPKEVMAAIEAHPDKEICVLYSGDTGLYSGATALCALLMEKDIDYRVIPGISSVQLLAAEIGMPWENWKIVSAHGRSIDPAAECAGGGDVLFLTDEAQTPQAICKALLANLKGENAPLVIVGSDLGEATEDVFYGTLAQAAEQEFPALSVLLVRFGKEESI